MKYQVVLSYVSGSYGAKTFQGLAAAKAWANFRLRDPKVKLIRIFRSETKETLVLELAHV